MAGRLIGGWTPAQDSNGLAMSGAKLHTYVPGTTTNKAAYTTAALNVAHTNPVIADSAGRFPELWAEEGEQFDIKWTDSSGVQIQLFEDIMALGSEEGGEISRDFDSGGRLLISGAAGAITFAAGSPTPDDTGGDLEIEGWNNTALDTLTLRATETQATGNLTVDGDLDVGGDLLVNGSVLIGQRLDSGSISSAQAALDVSIPTGYRHVRLELLNIYPASDADAYLRFNFGAGVKSGASDYYWTLGGTGGGSTVSQGDDLDSEIEMTFNTAESAGNTGSRYVIDIVMPTGSDTDRTIVDFSSSYKNFGGAAERVSGRGEVLTETARPTAVRFLFNGVNIGSCKAWALTAPSGL